jgi:hypothetical protein
VRQLVTEDEVPSRQVEVFVQDNSPAERIAIRSGSWDILDADFHVVPVG